MLKYLVERKAPGELYKRSAGVSPSESAEDLLCADFFGVAATYLPARYILRPFLIEAARRNPHAVSFEKAAEVLARGLSAVRFWPHLKLKRPHPFGSQCVVEPDVLLSHPGGPTLIIETKFWSRVDGDQLAREYLAGVAEFGFRDLFLLLVTDHLVPPKLGPAHESIFDYVARRVAEVPGIDEKTVITHVLWTNWQSSYRATESLVDNPGSMDIPSDFELPVFAMASDLLKVLQLRELEPIRRIIYDQILTRRPDMRALKFFLPTLGNDRSVRRLGGA